MAPVIATVIAHRGASSLAPENTLLAFEKAIELGAGAIECDVHACKSGEAVIIHDDTLERTTNGKGRVAAHTLAQLQSLDAGQGERIPTLEEAIAFIAGRAQLYIEIKNVHVAQTVARIITRSVTMGNNEYAQLPVISFNLDALLEVKRYNPFILIGATARDEEHFHELLETAGKHGLWSLNPCIDHVSMKDVSIARSQGFSIIVWTANTQAQIAHAKAIGADGIITDFPQHII